MSAPSPRAVASVLLVAALAACRTAAPEPPAEPRPRSEATPPESSMPSPAKEAELQAAPQERTRPPAPDVTTVDEATKAVLTGHPEAATSFLRNAVSSGPDARMALARALVNTGDYAGALEILEHGSLADDPAAHRRRAWISTRIGRWQPAVELLQAAHKRWPDDLAVQGDLLALLVATGQRGSSEAKRLMNALYDAYEAGRATTASELLAVARAALARGTKGAFHDANMVLGEAETAAPPDSGSWIADDIVLVRGEVFLEKYAGGEAATTYGLLLARDPWHPDALVGMARVHLDALQFAEAATAAKEALQVNPTHPDALAVLAKIALVEGRHERATSRAREALAVDEGHTQALAVLASLAISDTDAAAYAQHRDRALARNPTDGLLFRELADLLGFLHLYPEADAVLTDAAKRAPEDPYVRAAWGLNLLRLGDETRGREQLQWAWKRDPFNERTRNVLELYEKTIDPDYTLVRSGKLTLRVHEDDADILAPVLRTSVQRSVDALEKAYGHDAGALRLEFFRDPESFSIRTIGVPSLGAVAVCFGPVITFIGPYTGSFNLDNVIRHELAHVYAIAKSKGRVPRWFTEGLSEWESEMADPAYARESARLLVQARKSGRLRRLGELELAFIRADSGAMMEVAYATAAYAVRYLGQTYGRQRLIAILEGYATGGETEALFEQHLGRPFAQIEADFDRWFREQLDARLTGYVPSDDPSTDDPRDARLREAMAAAQERDTAGAIGHLERLVAGTGDGYPVRMMLAELVARGPKPQAAARHYEAAAKFNAEATEPHVELAKLARERRAFDDEARHLRQVLAIDADAMAPAARLLVIAIAQSDEPTAALALRRAQAIAPLHPLVLAAAAQREAAGGATETATALFTRALEALEETDQAGDETLVIMALAARRLGDESRAKQLAARIEQPNELPRSLLEQLGRAP